VLNDFTEQYELRQRINGRIDWKSAEMQPSREEWKTAYENLEARWNERAANRRSSQAGNASGGGQQM